MKTLVNIGGTVMFAGLFYCIAVSAWCYAELIMHGDGLTRAEATAYLRETHPPILYASYAVAAYLVVLIIAGIVTGIVDRRKK